MDEKQQEFDLVQWFEAELEKVREKGRAMGMTEEQINIEINKGLAAATRGMFYGPMIM